jgi:hypothetical protein
MFNSLSFHQRTSHNNATSYTPIPLQGFSPWSDKNMQEASPPRGTVPSHVIPLLSIHDSLAQINHHLIVARAYNYTSNFEKRYIFMNV